MQKERKLYLFINICIIFIAMLVLVWLLITNKEILQFTNQSHLVSGIILFILFYFLVNGIKMLRFYLIILESRIPFLRFLKLYMKTTFINITLPFKTGEIFRVYVYGYQLESYKNGLLTVLLERFFDICALAFLLSVFDFLTIGSLSFLAGLLMSLIVGCLIIYWVFPGFYRYMNKFLIFNIKGKKSIFFLSMLEKSFDFMKDINSLITGRAPFILFLSLVAWFLEFVMFKTVSMRLGLTYSMENFSQYLNAILGNGESKITVIYTISGSCILGILMLVIYMTTLKEKKHGE